MTDNSGIIYHAPGQFANYLTSFRTRLFPFPASSARQTKKRIAPLTSETQIHDSGNTAYSVQSVGELRKTVYTHTTRSPHAPTSVATIGVTDRPKPRRAPCHLRDTFSANSVECSVKCGRELIALKNNTVDVVRE